MVGCFGFGVCRGVSIMGVVYIGVVALAKGLTGCGVISDCWPRGGVFCGCYDGSSLYGLGQ